MSPTDECLDISSDLNLLFNTRIMAARSGISGIKPPAPLAVEHKIVRDTWRRWKTQWEDYCIVHSISERPAEVQVSLLYCHWTRCCESDRRPTYIQGQGWQ